MRGRAFLAALIMAGCLAPSASQAATVTAGAIGPVTVTGWGSCASFTTGIDFELNSPEFLLQVGHFPPAGPAAANADCGQSFVQSNQFGNRFPAAETPCGLPYHYAMKPDTLSVSGNTYTVTNQFRQCNGVISNQTTKIVIAATTITFTQTFVHTDGYTFKATGTLSRLW
jgi:hypothetical protein